MRTSLFALASVALLTIAGPAFADDPPPPPAPKPAVGPVGNDMQPSTPMSAEPASPEPMGTHGGPMMHHHEGPQVSLGMSSDRPHAMLFRSTGTSYVAAGGGPALTMTHVRTFVPVCTAPCRVTTDENATYRVGGDGMVLSDEFRLPQGQGGNVELKVNGGSLAARRAGGLLVGTGIATLVTGGALLIAGYTGRPDYTDPKYLGEDRYLKHDLDDSRHVRTAGFIIAPLGALFILTGSLLAALSNTTVETTNNVRLAQTKPRLTANGMALSF